jgi:hypothetical protein
MNYLFSICNSLIFNENILYTSETKSFFIHLLWGKISNIENEEQFSYLVEFNNSKGIIKHLKLNVFLSYISENIREPLRDFLLTIQTHFKLEMIANEKEEPLYFKCHVNLADVENLNSINRDSIESEKCLVSLIHLCHDEIFIESKSFFSNSVLKSININMKSEENINQVLSYEHISLISSMLTRKKILNEFDVDLNILIEPVSQIKLNFEKFTFEKKSNITNIKKQGGLILYENLSDVKKVSLHSIVFDEGTSLPSCIVTNVELFVQWKEEASNVKNIHFICIEKIEDLEKVTFRFLSLKNPLLLILDSIFNDDEYYENLQNTKDKLQELIESNVFLSKKDNEFNHSTQLSFDLAKRIFLNQSTKFPDMTVPISWINFNTVFYDTKNIVEPIIESSLWNWLMQSIDMYYIGDTNFLLNPHYTKNNLNKDYFLLKTDYKDISFHDYSWLVDSCILMPISQNIKSKIIPMQLYLNMDNEEIHFISFMDDLYNYMTNQMDVKTANNKKFSVKDMLFGNPNSDFPFDLYKSLQRKNIFTPIQGITNIYEQVRESFRELYEGLGIYDIFLHWKFDKPTEPSQKYVSVLNSLQDEQPHCFICYENPPEKFAQCGHGYCNDCQDFLIKQKDCFLLCPCPLCRMLISRYDWISVKENDNRDEIKKCVPSKYVKMFEELKNSLKQRILVIVPQHTSSLFCEYIKERFNNENLNKSIFNCFEDLHDEESWICVREEEDLIKCRQQIEMEIVYYISPELKHLKYTYMFLLYNTLSKPLLLVMLVISNQIQEEKSLVKLLEIF